MQLEEILKGVRDAENHEFYDMESDELSNDCTEDMEDDIPDDATFRLSEKMLFCISLYDAGLFNDEYIDGFYLFDDKRFQKLWELFEYRMVKHGYRQEEGKEVPLDTSKSILDILRQCLKDCKITDREDYLGEETAELVHDLFIMNLEKSGYVKRD